MFTCTHRMPARAALSQVIWEMNGENRALRVLDTAAAAAAGKALKMRCVHTRTRRTHARPRPSARVAWIRAGCTGLTAPLTLCSVLFIAHLPALLLSLCASSRKADRADPTQVGASMPGVVVDIRVSQGKQVKHGDVIAVLNAMKMETTVTAPRTGVVQSVAVAPGDTLDAGDLIAIVD
jgi:biotin carboxyl carrier protein